MARRKLSRIKEYDLAKTRLAALKSIDAALDLGNDMTVPNYEKTINDFTSLLGQYNTALSTVDDFYNQCIDSLKGITDMSERMLSGVGFKYTKKWRVVPVNRKGENQRRKNRQHERTGIYF